MSENNMTNGPAPSATGRHTWHAVAATILVLAAVGLGIALSTRDQRAPQSGSAHANAAHARPAAIRTLMVSTGREPAPSSPGTTMRALRLRGPVPATTVIGTVLSDDDCTPDAAGVSHCSNRIELANGRVLTVRHPHRMTEVACMTPGERLKARAV